MKQLKNNHNKLVGFVLLSLFIVWSACSCKKCNDPCNLTCENFDPCCGQAPANASFKIYEILQSNPTLESHGFASVDVATDTIIFLNFAHFKADFEADYYEWSIDGDNRTWNSREFNLRFSSLPFYTPVDIKLKVYKHIDKCFTSASDTAMFKKTLYTVPFDSTTIYGRYEGYLTSAPSSPNYFEIKPTRNQFGDLRDTLSGITPNCKITNSVSSGVLSVYRGYRSFYFSSKGSTLGCCLGLSGFAVIKGRNEITMTIGKYPPWSEDSCLIGHVNDPYLNDVFHGIKQ